MYVGVEAITPSAADSYHAIDNHHQNRLTKTMEPTASRQFCPAFHELNPSIRSDARSRSRQLIFFSLGGRGDSWFFVHLN